jgi:hypothetical protein
MGLGRASLFCNDFSEDFQKLACFCIFGSAERAVGEMLGNQVALLSGQSAWQAIVAQGRSRGTAAAIEP